MKVKDLIKVYTGHICLAKVINGYYVTEEDATKLSSIYYEYRVRSIELKSHCLYVHVLEPELRLTVNESLLKSKDKEEVILITLPYNGEESAFLSTDIPPEYLSLPISMLIEQEDLNIIIMEV